MVWRQKRNRLFDIRSYYKAFRVHNGECFPWKSVWGAKVPWKVSFFTWTAALGRILIVDDFIKRHVNIIDRCCMCKSNKHKVDHLL